VTEVLALIGSKEGLAHLALAVLDPEDIVIAPDPGYPVYAMTAVFAGCECYKTPLLEQNNFLVDFSSIPDEVCERAKLIWMNYPNNPTGSVAPVEFFEEAVAWARKWDVVIAHDNPYSEIYTDLPIPPSLLSVKGGKESGIEFNSLSKMFNMTGFRIGMAVGNAEIIDALARVKSNVDSGVFRAVQKMGVKALRSDMESVAKLRDVYRSRRKVVEETLEEAGYDVYKGHGTFYVWIKTPKGITSADFVGQVIEKTGIVMGPGSGWGVHGEGYFRICLTRDEETLRNAIARIVDLFPAE
jgi:LL-diaminopimelate aminotransferase